MFLQEGAGQATMVLHLHLHLHQLEGAVQTSRLTSFFLQNPEIPKQFLIIKLNNCENIRIDIFFVKISIKVMVGCLE